MNELFSEITFNGLTLKNRFIRAATWEGLATPEGEVTQKLVDMLVTLAKVASALSSVAMPTYQKKDREHHGNSKFTATNLYQSLRNLLLQSMSTVVK